MHDNSVEEGIMLGQMDIPIEGDGSLFYAIYRN
jgi:hypothetical protein